VHLDLRLSGRIIEKKIEITLKLFSGAWGKMKMIYEKNPEAQKSRYTVPLM
jgi:hypothetical protein